MKERASTGCDECRREEYTTQWPPPERIASMPQSDSYLHRCAKCGSFWVFSDGGSHHVDEEQARKDFPDAFS
jgi:hypothetical protein